jgi:hypothetical protein
MPINKQTDKKLNTTGAYSTQEGRETQPFAPTNKKTTYNLRATALQPT